MAVSVSKAWLLFILVIAILANSKLAAGACRIRTSPCLSRVHMEHPLVSSSLLFSLTFRFILLLFILLSVSKLSLATLHSSETDKLALLEFKSHVDDPLSSLATWNNSSHFCQWVGVTCGNKHQRVIALDLEGKNLVGTISAYIGNLSFLRSLSLASNSLKGRIPSETGRLFRLQNLNLSFNSLEGEIPVNLSRCSSLMAFDLQSNQLEKRIPSELGSLSKLEKLSLAKNHLSGKFPSSLGNLSSLQQLLFTYNNLEGEVPDTVAQMKSLKRFEVGVNNLSGAFPPSLYNLSSLIVIALAFNNFSGDLNPDMGIALPNLRVIDIAGNKFTGSIPASLNNASYFQHLDLPQNYFTGTIPLSCSDLRHLQWINAHTNLLGNHLADDLSFLSSLANCSQLRLLDVSHNWLGGELPNSITNLSTQLTWLRLAENFIGGMIPVQISNLASLTMFSLDQNFLTGTIPASIGKLSNLNKLYLGANKLTGEIPSSFGNMTRLLHLSLYNNSLHGSIPSSLGRCSYLQEIRLCHNKINGSIPKEVFSLPALSVVFNVSHNSLTGPLPPEVGNLKSLVNLDVSYNKFSKEIPGEIGEMLALEVLYMQGNFFEGNIPDLSRLKGIEYLDLSHNNLTGQIPSYTVSFSMLQNLNLSHNNLEGEVPVKGVFQNATAFEVYGNSRLCGGIQELQLHACPIKHRYHIALKLILPIGIAAAFCLTLASLISLRWLRKPKKNHLSVSSGSFGHFYQRVSYQELLHATGGFSERNLIGSGNFGSVYKGKLGPDETIVAVKVLNLQKEGAFKSFIVECQALGNVRHRNLVKILTACSSIDFEGKDFKAIVYEFMQNGNLDMWLHPEDGLRQQSNLSLLQRMNIAIDVASALLYLHHHSQTPILHCDLKPSNILLDDDLTARISDFGLARLLSESGQQALYAHLSSAGIKGTVGYAAPEYGMGGQLSTNGDVYNFGILLLEMFTGRRPTDDMFTDNLNLHNFVKSATSGRVMEILDQTVLNGTEETEDTVTSTSDWTSEQNESLILVFQIGLACSAESPNDRMDMRNVALKLRQIRDRLVGLGTHENQEGLMHQ
ncbi:LRR receptor-like serine/threonine-protein kinase EFR [Morella rubra]|uniref:non-specific serine/threonine protein kinase n=1 Tax=Morella rubra TaxID=262757 RepID=A0A6A1VCU7_9ROSI|nr:LRR receptor-like serine/threonine-protein kinase EFR [Morella rubra]